MTLDTPANHSSTVSPICLPASDDVESLLAMEDNLWVTGWGKTNLRSRSSDTLQELEVNTVDSSRCAQLWRQDELIPGVVCIWGDEEAREGVCQGDSGGPLMVRRSGRFVLVGSTSFSLVDCQSPFPNVFTRVSAFLNWIAVGVKDYGSLS